jgi:hypothetical protein
MNRRINNPRHDQFSIRVDRSSGICFLAFFYNSRDKMNYYLNCIVGEQIANFGVEHPCMNNLQIVGGFSRQQDYGTRRHLSFQG